MDVDAYRLAYNVFHSNWKRFGIPAEDIPPPKTEEVDSLDLIVPGFSIAVALFQIASRKHLKAFLDDKECRKVYNLRDVYKRFENIMKQALPRVGDLIGSPEIEKSIEDASQATGNEEVSENTMKEYPSKDNMETDLPEEIKEENIPNDTMKEKLCKDATKDLLEEIKEENLSNDTIKEKLCKDAKKDLSEEIKENLPNDSMKEKVCKDATEEELPENAMEQWMSGNVIHSDDIPALIAYSLAVCTELALYDKEGECNKDNMKYLPEMWKEYFEENLKSFCEEAHCTQDHLKTYSNSIKCPEKLLNKFISENKNEYTDIADKFYDYTEKNYAVESPDKNKDITEIGIISKGLSFLKMKEKFTALKEVCLCVKGSASEEVPLLYDYSPCASSSASTTPSI